ncbi:hypothetical protein ACHAW6_012089 [Cyclotella cf. meneghiniana]
MKHLRVLAACACILPRGCAFYYRAHGNRKILHSSSSLVHRGRGTSLTSLGRPSLANEEHVTSNHLSLESNLIAVRGGACSDSTPALFGKVAASAAVETFIMYQLLAFGAAANTLTSMPSGTRILQAVLALFVVFGSSYFGQLIDSGMSAATRQVLAPNEIPGDADWYLNLQKPFWNPPGWLFPIMWLVVSKPTQFVAVTKLMANNNKTDIMIPLLVYCAHLSLGDAWNKVFFGLQCIGRGVTVISAFWGVLLLSALLFYKVDPSAGIFLVPTFLWVSVAAALNWSIFILNAM